MKYEFSVYQMQVDENVFWIAESKALKGCVGQGDTADEALKELEANEIDWLETARECGISIPVETVRKENQFSGKVSVRFSPFVHEEASNNAQALKISLNQYLNDAIVDYNARYNHMQLKNPSRNIALSETSSVVIDFNQNINRQ